MNQVEEYDSDIEILEPSKLEDEWLKNEILLGTELLKCGKSIPSNWNKFKERSETVKIKAVKSSLGGKSCRAKNLIPSNGEVGTVEKLVTLCDKKTDSSSLKPHEKIKKSKEFPIYDKDSSRIDEIKGITVSHSCNNVNLFQTNKQKMLVPQLKLLVDGKVIVSDDILSTQQSLGDINSDVEYVKKYVPKNEKKSRICLQGWTHEDTLRFYKALHLFGSDFALMKTVFPGRSRRNLKCKFKREERVRGTLVDKVIYHPTKFNPNDVVQELDDEYKLERAKSTCGRNMQVKKRPNQYKHVTIRGRGVCHSAEMSAKELKVILNSEVNE